MLRRLSNRLIVATTVVLLVVASCAADESPSKTTSTDDDSLSTSFEQANAGRFDKLPTPIGVWKPTAGLTIVDIKHAKTGKQCLQLTGGKQTSVTLDLADGADTSGQLTFRAERWTRREPFSFRIEALSDSGWKEVFNGDKRVRVGRAFLSDVAVPLGDNSIKQLRFTVTSPPNTGVLIDDMRLAPVRPQQIVSVKSVPFTLPALVGNSASPLIKLRIETLGSLNPISITGLRGTIIGTPFMDRLQVSKKLQGNGERLALPTANDLSTSWEIAPMTLADGENFVWLSGKLNHDADVDQRVGGTISEVAFSNGQRVSVREFLSSQRIGVAVRNGGDNGVHTFRIPGLATTNKGTLIGVYDVRHRGRGDLPGDIDVGMSRSTDGGKSWKPMKVIMNKGNDPAWRFDGVGDPAILVDRNTNTIWVAATWSHGNRSWTGSGPGMTPEKTGQLMLVRSDDDGVTWSNPINITQQVKNPEWSFILQGPGKGITMRDGTIVFAAQFQDPPNSADKLAHRLPHSTIIYSQDHGKTWQVGTGAFDDTTESQVVELEPGLLMLNCRYNRKAARVVMTTRDMGKTWTKHSTSERSLIEPGSCMASLINVDREVGRNVGGWLLFSNPDSTRGRHHITIKASRDQGLTWPKQHRLLLDEGNGSGYSCMSMIDDKTVGILYEGSQAHMTFQRIPLSDLVGEPKISVRAVPQPPSGQSLKLPRVFGSRMVLQADAKIPVWGRAKPSVQVKVVLENETQIATANENGRWQLRLQPRPASATPVTLLIQSAEERLELQDVLVGEVWVCAGQSNMEWPLRQSAHGTEELAAANHKTLRLLNLVGAARGSSGSYSSQHLSRLTPENFCHGAWNVASAESAAEFSAVAWYFGRQLQEELNVPVGLICPAVGGTPTEAWIPREALEADSDLRGLVAGNWLDNSRLGDFCRTRGLQNLLPAIQAGESIPGDDLGPHHSFKPGFMWSAGIAPLIPYAVRGAIWYQGESNAETRARVDEHARLFPLLVNEWRARWGQAEFPFLYVQLPALNRPHWPWFREGQRRMLNDLPNVGMAITIDTGHPTNVHPTSKKIVGQRLAKWALGTTYISTATQSTADYSGPIFESAKRTGNTIAVTFQHADGGLKSFDGKPPRHFEISGKDGQFHSATAKIVGRNTIEVTNPNVPEPQSVRYAWLPYPDPPINFGNNAGLPASPFTAEHDGPHAPQ